MNLDDFLITYLACGAPFGVFYFFQNRTKFVAGKLWLSTIITFAFWIPFAFRLLRENKILNKVFSSDAEVILDVAQEKKLKLIQKQFENFLRESNLKISLYEFRETIDRYIGLSLTNQSNIGEASVKDKELFRISKNKNVELAAICLYRRNQKRLLFHHIQARQDFLHFINKLSEFGSNKKIIDNLAVEFLSILKDFEAIIAFEKMFSSTPQTKKYSAVKQLEKDLWNTEIHKLLSPDLTSIRLQIMTAMTKLRGKD